MLLGHLCSTIISIIQAIFCAIAVPSTARKVVLTRSCEGLAKNLIKLALLASGWIEHCSRACLKTRDYPIETWEPLYAFKIYSTEDMVSGSAHPQGRPYIMKPAVHSEIFRPPFTLAEIDFSHISESPVFTELRKFRVHTVCRDERWDPSPSTEIFRKHNQIKVLSGRHVSPCSSSKTYPLLQGGRFHFSNSPSTRCFPTSRG